MSIGVYAISYEKKNRKMKTIVAFAASVLPIVLNKAVLNVHIENASEGLHYCHASIDLSFLLTQKHTDIRHNK